MEMFCVQGGRALRGVVRVEGSKNASLPILAATLAVPGRVVLENIPQLQDVLTMRRLLLSMGAEIHESGPTSLAVDSSHVTVSIAPYELVRQMRAGVCVLGPLLARFGKARVSLPGGCNIGHRPIDIHLRGLAQLGAEIRLESGYIVAESSRLRGAEVDLRGVHGPTVTGTCNVLIAASLARGRSVLRSAAREPEVADLGRFLNAAGARITGLGTEVLEIDGVDELQPVRHRVIPDRIEAATLAIATAMTAGDVRIEDAPVEHLTAVIQVLQSIGVDVEVGASSLRIHGTARYRPVRLRAEPYPGLPTDVQAQLTALLCLVPGESRIADHVFPDRFMHAAELVRMGADIRVHGNAAYVCGVAQLSGAPVMASDLRASAALVLAAISAQGFSEIRRVYHLDRGYHAFERKLNSLGACIERVHEEVPTQLVPAPHLDLSGHRARNRAVRRD